MSAAACARAAEADVLELLSHSSLDTERLGERLGRLTERGDVIAVSGDLGSGKTVLARGVAGGLGIDPGEVTSPTFIILREHGGGRLPLFHLDLYRLSGSDLASTGWEEAVQGDGVTVIEWPERAVGALPRDRLEIHLEHVAETRRRLRVAAGGPRSRGLLEGLRPDAARD